MGMGFAPTWLRQVSPPASQNHFNHWLLPLARRLCHHQHVLVSYPDYQGRMQGAQGFWPPQWLRSMRAPVL